VVEPFVGTGAETVMHVQRENREAERRRCRDRGVQQRRRIAPAAVGDGDGASLRSSVSARWCR
jgi:hypothetical protein